MSPPYNRLSRALAAIGPRAPRDLRDLVAHRPPVGALPLPWSNWTLIALVDYGARKRWAYDMIRSRVAPHLARRWGGDVALEDLQERCFVPGLPEWECELDGMYSQVINRISGDRVHVDLVHGPGVFSFSQLAAYFRSQRHPGPAARRLLELHPSCWALRLAVELLLDAGVIHPVDEFDFELSRAAQALEGPIATFLDAWKDPDRRSWLAALIGDWPAAHAAAMAAGDPRLVALTGDRARECRERWLEHIRGRIAEEGLDDESLHALAEAGATDLPEYLRRALDRPDPVSLTALELIHDDPGFVPLVAALFPRSPEGPLPHLLGGRCALYLARHGHRTREMLDWLGSSEGRHLGRTIHLALERAPDMALPLIRRALRSTWSHDRATAAAVLALVDEPWSHRELRAVLDESDDREATIESRAALRESRVPAARAIADAWESRNPANDEDSASLDRSRYHLEAVIERDLLERMGVLRDLVLRVRAHIGPAG